MSWNNLKPNVVKVSWNVLKRLEEKCLEVSWNVLKNVLKKNVLMKAPDPWLVDSNIPYYVTTKSK